MIERSLQEPLEKKLASSKLLLVQGPDHSGKVTLVEKLLSDANKSYRIIDCKTHNSPEEILEEIRIDSDYIILNEIQFASGLDTVMEAILSDEVSSRVISICSYKPDLDEHLIEALKHEGLYFEVFPPTFYESAQHFGMTNQIELLEDRLIYGSFPLVLEDTENAELLLREMIAEFVFHKLGVNERVNKGEKMYRLLQLLAFEIGNPISYNELGERCDLDNETVQRYIRLLEESFIIITLPTYQTGQRYELKKAHCFYFMDNGIRNALIQNFNKPLLRNDMQALWKNYLISERIKWTRMNGGSAEFYFWRTHTRQQIDLIELDGDELFAYNMDWEKRNKNRIPGSFEKSYPKAITRVLNRNTFMNFLTRKVS